MPEPETMSWEEAEKWEARGLLGDGPIARRSDLFSAIALARQEKERAGRAEANSASAVEILNALVRKLEKAVEGYVTMNKRENTHSLYWRERAEFYEQMIEYLHAYRESGK